MEDLYSLDRDLAQVEELVKRMDEQQDDMQGMGDYSVLSNEKNIDVYSENQSLDLAYNITNAAHNGSYPEVEEPSKNEGPSTEDKFDLLGTIFRLIGQIESMGKFGGIFTIIICSPCIVCGVAAWIVFNEIKENCSSFLQSSYYRLRF